MWLPGSWLMPLCGHSLLATLPVELGQETTREVQRGCEVSPALLLGNQPLSCLEGLQKPRGKAHAESQQPEQLGHLLLRSR